jgi:hypothetical protein
MDRSRSSIVLWSSPELRCAAAHATDERAAREAHCSVDYRLRKPLPTLATNEQVRVHIGVDRVRDISIARRVHKR